MKQLSKYLVILTLAILTISVIVTTTIVYTAHAATNVPIKTTVVNTALTTKTVQLFTNQAVNQGQTLNSGFTTTTGYKRAAMYVSEVDSPDLNINGQFSLDGTNGFTLPMIQGTLGFVNLYLNPGQTSYMIGAGDVVGPMFRVSVTNGSSTAYPPSATVSVTLYLMPS